MNRPIFHVPYLRVMRSPRYVPLWLGQVVSNLGDTLNYVALVVLVFDLSHSGLAVSGLVLTEIVPTLLLGPVAGILIDRCDRKRLLIATDLARTLLILLLAVTHVLWTVYLLAALLAVGATLFNPALQAVIPALLDEQERLAANSVAWSSGRLVQIIGAALAGGLIAWAGTTLAFLVNAASFAFSAAMLARLSIPSREAPPRMGGLRAWWQDAREGWAYARCDLFVARLVPVQALTSLAVGATSALLVVLATQHLHLGFGWLLAAIGVGALLGPFLANWLTRGRYLDVRLLFVPYLIRGAGDIALGLVVGLPWALLILCVYGLNTSTGMVASNTILQTVIPDRVRGRVFTLLDVTWAAMRLLSLGVGGWLADRAGISSVYVIGGTLLTLAGVLGLVLLGRVPLDAPSCATPQSGHATGAGLQSGSADRCGGFLATSAGRPSAGRRTPRRTREGQTP
jgi:MFS family permease